MVGGSDQTKQVYLFLPGCLVQESWTLKRALASFGCSFRGQVDVRQMFGTCDDLGVKKQPTLNKETRQRRTQVQGYGLGICQFSPKGYTSGWALFDLVMGQNLWLHFGVDKHPFATYFDVHQGYWVLTRPTAN